MLVSLISNAEADSFDVVVVQATPGGIAAAVAAAEEGLDVALLESSNHIGGLAAGGLSNTDFISFQSLGGTWRDFMNRVVTYYAERYGENSQQVKDCRGGGWYEPKVAEKVFQEMLEDAGVTLLKQHRLLSAETLAGGERSQIVSVTAEDLERPGGSPRRIEAKVFVDASYAGDLLAAAGASYELQNVQAFNYRVVMSRDPANQVPFAEVRPNHYEELEFEGVRSWLLNEEPEMDLDRLFKIRKMPKTRRNGMILTGGSITFRFLAMAGPGAVRLTGGRWKSWADRRAGTLLLSRHGPRPGSASGARADSELGICCG